MSAPSAMNECVAPRWYRQRWPWLLMLGPATVAIAGGVTIWLAIASNDGLVSDDYYKRGLAINRTLERTARAEALGIGAIVDVSHNGVAQVLLTSEAAVDETMPEAVRLVLSHPTRAGADVSATLSRVAHGRYAARVPSPPPGRWRVFVETDAWRLAGTDIDGPLDSVPLGRARR